MIALPDLGLFVIDPEAWNDDRETYAAPIGTLALHDRYLRRYPVQLLWSDDFFLGVPWGHPGLRDLCVALTSLHEYLKGNNRLLTPDALPPPPDVVPVLDPDLLADEEYADEVRDAWLGLLGAVTPEERFWAETEGMAVLTWERPDADARELRITLGLTPPVVRTAALLAAETGWQAFLEAFHRPNLSGRRVAVLGGHRPPFERARERLGSYGLTDLRRIPPVSEQNRTGQELRRSLLSVDLVVVCTNYMGHTDTDQLKGIRDGLQCAVFEMHADSDARIEKAIVDHFRGLTAAPSTPGGAGEEPG